MKKHWIVLTLVALVIVGAVTAAFFLSRPQGSAVEASVNMNAATETPQGVALETGFTLTLDYKVTEEELRDMLVIDPEIGAYTLTGSGKTWTLTPESPLEKNRVYTFGIRGRTGEVVRSFAFQTKSDLLIGQSFPNDKSNYVPVETGIELTFNATGVPVQDYFTIQPEVPGTFEVSEYTAIFRPDAPLSEDNIYRVTVKAGLTAPNGMQLAEDYNFSFETVSAGSDKWDYNRLRLAGEYSETFLTGDPLAVELSSGRDTTTEKYDVKLHQFADINDYINELKAHDVFYEERYGRKTEYVADTTSLQEVVSFTGELFRKGEYQSQKYVILPDTLPEGHYIVTISGKDSEGNEQFVQKLIQIRNLSLYAQSSDGDTLLWLNDAGAGEPMADRLVYVTDVLKSDQQAEVITQSDGTAQVRTDKMEHAYLSVMESGRVTYFERIQLSPEDRVPFEERYFGGLYTDREIYQPDDTVRFWGVVKPRRVTAAMPNVLYAELGSGLANGNLPLYKQKLEIKPDGTFEGSIKVSGLSGEISYNSLYITDGTTELTPDGIRQGIYIDKYLQFKQYTKPPFVIETKPAKDYFYADEPIVVDISAHFFDGTPVSGGELKLYGYGAGLNADGKEVNITLDQAGKGSMTLQYIYADTYSAKGGDAPEWMPQRVYYSVGNADTQNVSINTSGYLTILPSRNAMQMTRDPATGAVTVETALLDASKVDRIPKISPLSGNPETLYEQVKGAPVDLPVTLKLYNAKTIKTPIGSYYDYVNKKTINQYKYTVVEQLEKTVQTKTIGGKVVVPDLPVSGGENRYWIAAEFEGGVEGTVRCLLEEYDPYSYEREGSKPRYAFGNTSDYSIDNKQKPALNEEITLGLYRNNAQIKNEGTVLYSAMQRKVLDVGMFTEDTHKVTFSEDYLPNVVLAGAYFDGRHVYKIEPYRIMYNFTEKTLKMDIKTDKDAYLPGETATLQLTVTDQAGQPATGSACVGVVDEAIFAMADQKVALAEQLYEAVFYPNLAQKVSYTEYDLANASMDAGGKGGGGGEGTPIRQEFVDTAAFQTVTLDAMGKATLKVVLPDNMTSWRLTAAAVTSDLKAGDTFRNTIVTQPFYVQPLLTETYLEGDDIAAAINGVGTGVKLGDDVTYTAVITDGAGVEVDSKTASGKLGTRVPFNFGKYDPGSYKLTITGKTGELSDAMSQEFTVMKQSVTIPVFKNMTLTELSALESVRYPVRVTFFDQRLEPYMTALQKLSMQEGDRTEILAGAHAARLLQNTLLEENLREKVVLDPHLEGIQVDGGGIKALPFAKADAATTAKMLIAAPSLVQNAVGAGTYLESVLKDAAATPNDRVMAYMGLAALKKPVLLDVAKQESDPKLTIAQKLYLGVGLAKLGDFTGAQKIYDGLGEQVITEGKMKYVENGGTADERLQNTAAALMLTSIISSPDADGFMLYFNQLDNDRARDVKVVYNLEILTYLQSFTMPDAANAGKFSCMIDGQREEFDLGTLPVKSMEFGQETLRNADFKVVSGTVTAGTQYISYPSKEPFADGGKLKAEKSYSGDLRTAGQIKVTIKLDFDPSAPSGIYRITDYIPAGMRYMPTNGQDYGDINPRNDWMWSNVQNEGQQVNGVIYRNLNPEVWDDAQQKMVASTTPKDMEGNPIDINHYEFSYYVSGALAGEFVSERAYITPNTQGISAFTNRGKITIAP